MLLTFPGKPVTRRISPADIEVYLEAKGYKRYLSIGHDWPRDLAHSWMLPRWPEPGAPPMHIKPVAVGNPPHCANPLDKIVEAIAQNEERTPGEVLRDIKTLAKEFAKARAKTPGK